MSSGNSTLYGTRTSGGQHGDVFTSPLVVGYMLDLVGYSGDRDLSRLRIAEPSCGDGEFVVEIARRLLQSARRFGFDAQEAFLRNVRAYDIDEAKVCQCRERLSQIGFGQAAQAVVAADFLQVRTDPVDIVVGNPPYIRYENIPARMLDVCRSRFKTFHYRCDLYVPFFEKSLAMLESGGRHCFICSNRWLKNEYGKKLRQMVASSYRLWSIVNLEHADAFQEDVLAYPAITVISNDFPAQTFQYAECLRVEELPQALFEERMMPRGADWTAAFSTVLPDSGFQTIEQQGFKIGIGVATGADTVFISADLPQKVEPELLMPGINARDLRGNRLQWQGEYLLNPYNDDGTLVNLDDYPRANAYLESHRERLQARHVARQSPSRWYKTIDRIRPALRTQPKILLPDMSGNTFIFVDDGEFYPLHNIYYITGRSSAQLRLLAAFLMSDFVRQQLQAVTNQMNGGFARWQSQHLRKLRLPRLSTIPNEDVNQILAHYELKEIASINKRTKKYMPAKFVLA